MIVVQLIGGLGNQMFQYALGRKLAVQHNTELFLDPSNLETDLLRSYSLDAYPIKAELISEKIRGVFFRQNQKLLTKIAYKVQTIFRPTIIYYEPHFSVDKHVFSLSGNIYLSGYWQSEKYFSEIATLIRKEFTYSDPVSESFKKYSTLIDQSMAVSLHIRRGDYVLDSKVQTIHGTCDLDYYYKAVDHLSRFFPDLQLFVFSDDPKWVSQNLSFSNEIKVHIVSGSELTEHEDLALMTRCKHHIIANSSFSWWGAWLNDYPQKKVIAPKRWFADEERNAQTKDLKPAAWTEL